MENRSLKTIQVFSKIGKIFSKIVYICCIVGAIGSIIGIASMKFLGGVPYQIGNVTIHGMIEKSAEMSIGSLYAAMIVGLIFCIAEGVIAGMSTNFFKKELERGTPFTYEGADEMLRLGIWIAAMSVAAITAAGIAYAVVNKMFADVADMHVDDFQSVGVGIAFIVVSFLCRYGASLSGAEKEEN